MQNENPKLENENKRKSLLIGLAVFTLLTCIFIYFAIKYNNQHKTGESTWITDFANITSTLVGIGRPLSSGREFNVYNVFVLIFGTITILYAISLYQNYKGENSIF